MTAPLASRRPAPGQFLERLRLGGDVAVVRGPTRAEDCWRLTDKGRRRIEKAFRENGIHPSMAEGLFKQ